MSPSAQIPNRWPRLGSTVVVHRCRVQGRPTPPPVGHEAERPAVEQHDIDEVREAGLMNRGQHVPAQLVRALRRGLVVNARQRHESMSALADALTRVLVDLGEAPGARASDGRVLASSPDRWSLAAACSDAFEPS